MFNSELIEEGRSEINRFSWNPAYIKKFLRNYRFEEINSEELVFQVYHIDDFSSTNIKDQTLIGEAQFSLRDLVVNKFQEVMENLTNDNYPGVPAGRIKIKALQSQDSYESVNIEFGVKNYISKDPIILKIWHKTDLDKWRPIYLSEPTIQKKNNYWPEATIVLTDMIRDKATNYLRFEVYEISKNSKYVLKCDLNILAVELLGKVVNEERIKEELHFKKQAQEDEMELNKKKEDDKKALLNKIKEEIKVDQVLLEAKQAGIESIDAKKELPTTANDKAKIPEKEKPKDIESQVIEFLMKSKNERYRNFLLVRKIEIKKVFRFYDYLVSSLEMKTFVFMDLTRSKINVEYFEIFSQLEDSFNKEEEEEEVFKVKEEEEEEQSNNILDQIFTKDPQAEEKLLHNSIPEINQSLSSNEIEKKSSIPQKLSEPSEFYNNDSFNGKKFKIKKIRSSSLSDKEISFDEQIGKTKKSRFKKFKKVAQDDEENADKDDYVRDKLELVNPKSEFQICLDTLIRYLIKIDSSRGFPFFCFGSKLPPLFDSVINCFSSTMDIMKPEVDGYYGFFDAYTKILGKVDLYGPANLSESMENLIKFVSTENFDHKTQFYAVAIFIVTSRITDLIHTIKLLLISLIV